MPSMPSTCVVRPDNPAKVAWDSFVVLLIVYSIVVIPVRVGFTWQTTNFTAEWYAELAIDACFLTDIVLSFRTAYIEDSPEQNTRVLITDWKAISARYLRTWFVLDLVSSVPLDIIIDLAICLSAGTSCTSDESGGAAGIARLLRFVRLSRL